MIHSLMEALFSKYEMATSSVKGTKCPANVGKPAKPPLNKDKLNAIRGIT